MFYPIENGSLFEIPDNAFGYVFKCYVPPVGFGINVANGKIEKTDILPASEIPEQQFWERPTLPLDFKDRRKKEREIQKLDKTFVDPYLEEIRLREWGRRLRGVWFWNYNSQKKQSELIYITGLHYLYITYWKFQGKHLDFRVPDRDLFYVVQYCMEDEQCLGLNELTKRKNGKTARVGCWEYERTSRLNNHHGGFQSKTDDDAEKAFRKAIIQPWQKLPDFFRPRYDLLKGDNPSELMFFATSRRGEKVLEDDDSIEEPLESFIDFMAASELAYDGSELHSYVSDEAGKTKKPVSIKERQNVVRYATEIDGSFHGKHWYTTTVEPEKGEEENYDFQDMTANSNPLERDANGRTGTGLYTYFLPAQKGMFFDKYGYPDEIRALTFLDNTIKGYEDKGDTRGLSSFKRKNPRSFKEAFSTDGEFALYNPELLNNQLDNISWTDKFTERGDLVWKDGYRVKRPIFDEKSEEKEIIGYEPNTVEWKPNKNGKFEKLKDWFPREPSRVFYDNTSYCPNNNHAYAIGCDPFKYDKTKDKRRSNCSALVYQIPDPIFKSEYDDMFTLLYSYREESTLAANEDILLMAWWCGCQVLFERNVNHWKDHFREWECSRFLMWLPDELEPGVATGTETIQTICNYTEAYINEHVKKVYFKRLIRKDTGWLGFKVEEHEKFDDPMAAGITLISVKGLSRRYLAEPFSILDYFPKRSTKKSYS